MHQVQQPYHMPARFFHYFKMLHPHRQRVLHLPRRLVFQRQRQLLLLHLPCWLHVRLRRYCSSYMPTTDLFASQFYNVSAVPKQHHSQQFRKSRVHPLYSPRRKILQSAMRGVPTEAILSCRHGPSHQLHFCPGWSVSITKLFSIC